MTVPAGTPAVGAVVAAAPRENRVRTADIAHWHARFDFAPTPDAQFGTLIFQSGGFPIAPPWVSPDHTD